MSFAQQLTKLLVVKFTVYFFPKLQETITKNNTEQYMQP